MDGSSCVITCRWPTGQDYARSLTGVNDAYVNGMGGSERGGCYGGFGDGALPGRKGAGAGVGADVGAGTETEAGG